MICYRDKIYCPHIFYQDCRNNGLCGRALTDDVLTAAGKIGLPICQFSEMPKCHSSLDEAEESNGE